MDTKTFTRNQDKRHFIVNSKNSKILGSIQSWFGSLPMAKFYDGEWFGTKYEVIPLNRRFKIKIPNWLSGEEFDYYWTRPYYDKNRVKFRIIIHNFGTKELRDFNISENFLIAGEVKHHYDVPTNKGLPVGAKEFDNVNETEFYLEGETIYSLGGLSSDDKRILVKADFLSGDKAYAKFEEILLGGVVGAIIGILGTIIARAILGI